jgi:hypothetical protein
MVSDLLDDLLNEDAWYEVKVVHRLTRVNIQLQ